MILSVSLFTISALGAGGFPSSMVPIQAAAKAAHASPASTIWAQQQDESAPSAEQAAGPPELVDRPLEPYQSQLLVLAFEAASVLPDVPHLKNKARFQEEVLEAFLELGQLASTQARLERVTNWRRGALLGKLAVAALQAGAEGDVAPWLEEAERISKGKLGELGQDWRRDRILVEVAHARVLTGRREAVRELESEVEPAQRAQLEVIRARLLEEDDLEAHLAFVEGLMAGGQGQFEDVQAGLESIAELLARFWAEAELRERMLRAVRSSWTKMPVGVQLRMHVRIGRAAAAAGDLEGAREWALLAEEFVRQYRWLEQDTMAALAQVAVLQHEAGQTSAGVALADEARGFFRENQESIQDMFRGDGLRPLAEAYAQIGQLDSARSVYAEALTEALVNPNTRPRCHDLARALVSMARHEVEPSPELWEQVGRVLAAIDPDGQ